MAKDFLTLSTQQKYLSTNIERFLQINNLKGENFENTPWRVAMMWDRFFEFGKERPDFTSFESLATGLIEMKNHTSWGFCPHHLLPVQYKFYLAYIPKGRVLGASKLARLCDWHLRTLPLQEDLGCSIVQDLFTSFPCQYVICKIEGMHLCYVMRGVKSKDAIFKTTSEVGERK